MHSDSSYPNKKFNSSPIQKNKVSLDNGIMTPSSNITKR